MQSASFFSNVYRRDYEHWPDSFACEGTLETSLLPDEQFPLLEAVTNTDIQIAESSIGGSFDAPLNWYRALMANINLEDEDQDPERTERNVEGRLVGKPTLWVGALRDPVARPDFHGPVMERLIEDLSIVYLKAGHWPQLEASEATNRAFENFFMTVERKLNLASE